MDAQEIITAGRLKALHAAPYFRSIILNFVVREAPGLGTVAVTDNGFFLVDYAFIMTLGGEVPGPSKDQAAVKQMAGLWIHETFHRLNKHGQRRGTRDPRVWNFAGDMAINTTIREMGMDLPPDGMWPSLFGFAEGLPADEYYEMLMKLPQQKVCQAQAKGAQGQKGEKGQGQGGKGPKGEEGDSEGESEEGGGQDADHDNPGGGDPSHGDDPRSGGGWCGSCAGRKVPGEPDKGDPDERSEAEMERGVREVASAIAEYGKKNIGKLPASLQRWAEEALQPAKVPWRQKLASVTRMAVAWSMGAIDHKYDSPSRRQAGIGYGSGRPILPRLRRPIPRVAVVIDTSGSMGSAEVTSAMNEVKGVLDAVGAQVDFIACDAAVHSMVKVSSIREAVANLKGGGGTDFRPAFEAAEKLSPKPNVLIFATDGYGPAPAAPPFGMKVVWLLIGKNAPKPAVWGDEINIDEL